MLQINPYYSIYEYIHIYIYSNKTYNVLKGEKNEKSESKNRRDFSNVFGVVR